MSQTQQLSRVERIENRIDKAVMGSIGVSAQRGMAINSMEQAMEVAKLMAVSDKAVPAHLRENPGACLAVAIQGWEWGINPFAIANKSYVVNDRLGYEATLYHAVLLKRAPIAGRIRETFTGKDMTRSCRLEATLNDGTGTKEYTSPELSKITTKNSPLWKSDLDQQLFYYSVRAFARRHFPDVMMGIYTVDELLDSQPLTDGGGSTQVNRRGMAGLSDRMLPPVTARPLSEGQTLDTDPEANVPHVAPTDEDAEAILRAASPSAREEPAAAGTPFQVPEEQQADAGAEAATPQSFDDACNSAASESGVDESVMKKYVAGYAKLHTRSGKPEHLTAEHRARVLATIRSGKVD